ncbi:MAG: spore cortex biosynthesis protein YabQ [Alicyclobacillaceae bacterium]|jgi:spore cortex biosynthesis protein YabQ|uniref:spore cortex biosynthesis protein YabQ n=1 Tax=Alicyclobacillus sp. SP_1 TaxID=2942475 RepID=UPI002157E6C8|nr:spore cortex biosynthesis protein YabQ [Alicyclobacillus sp. SP_1]MCY0887851.1 spore cortex biosynthesis protein YabQ [Alicyclobacillaceae bacterium]
MNSTVLYMLGMTAIGFGMGTVFDFYNTVLGSSRWLRRIRPSLDIFFWVVAAAVVFRCSLATDSGRFRMYTFGILLVGYLLYRISIRRVVIGSADALVRFVAYLLRIVWRTFRWLVWNPFWYILKIGFEGARAGYRIGVKLEDVLVWTLKLVLRVLFFPLSSNYRATKNFWNQVGLRWEGFWNRLSNLLKQRSRET